ncbi:MAG: site-specific DNA-methyltransferase [Rubrobacteraceae bacterium]
MPELYWKGKRSVVDHAGKVPSCSLRHVPEASVGEGSGNEIVHGDNLRALKALLPRYGGRVKLVFIDPPYNADGEVWTYSDRIDAPDIEDWPGKVEVDDPLRQDKWLSMMYPRLTLLRGLLRSDGVIFVTIGDNELHHLRLLLDEVFGARNFLGCAVWEKGPSGGDKKQIVSVHNYVVIYARDKGRAALESPGVTTWWTGEDFGDSREARRELEEIFPEVEERFAIPKPTRLVRRILEFTTHPSGGDLVLDCFAGSGTTAHAVLDQNSQDGGNRRFILVEAEDFTDPLTAERVRRVIRKSDPPNSGFND